MEASARSRKLVILRQLSAICLSLLQDAMPVVDREGFRAISSAGYPAGDVSACDYSHLSDEKKAAVARDVVQLLNQYAEALQLRGRLPAPEPPPQ